MTPIPPLEPVPIIEEVRKLMEAADNLAWATEVEIQGGHRTRSFISQHRAKCSYNIKQVRDWTLAIKQKLAAQHEAAPTPAMDVEGLASQLNDLVSYYHPCCDSVKELKPAIAAKLTAWLIPHDAALTAKVRGDRDEAVVALRDADMLLGMFIISNRGCEEGSVKDRLETILLKHADMLKAHDAAEERGKLP